MPRLRPVTGEEWFFTARFLVSTGLRYAASACRNLLSTLAGRKLRQGERILFVRQYVKHLLGVQPLEALTCVRVAGREGPGSQALLTMNAIVFARAAGLRYEHTPFLALHHADRPQPEWSSAWESVFNFGLDEAVCDFEARKAVNFCHNFPFLEFCLGMTGRRAELARAFREAIPEFRRKYYAGGLSPRTTREVTIAIHVRRGPDVSATQNSGHFTETGKILRTFLEIRSALESHGIAHRAAVYSVGERGEFEEFARLGAQLFTDPGTDPVWTLREMIEADILVLARSMFSYCAGLISDGIKIYEAGKESVAASRAAGFLPSWEWRTLAPADDWIVCGQDGTFDQEAFGEQLRRLAAEKRDASR